MFVETFPLESPLVASIMNIPYLRC